MIYYVELGISSGLTSGKTRFVSINGKVPERPLWRANGLPAERLPFLGSHQSLNRLGLPFEHLGIAAAANNAWQIFSRGDE